MRENDIIDSSTNPSIWQESREAPQKCVKYSLSYPQIIYKKHLTDTYICSLKAKQTGGIYEEERYTKKEKNIK
jgi:hypothetical protein